MNTHHITPDDVQVLENVLDDTPTPGVTRRALLHRAAVGAAVASAAVAVPDAALAAGAGGQVTTIIDTAVTAEALAVTYLTGLITHASKTGVTKLVPVLKAVNSSEYDHYKALKSLGAKPVATRFWVPDAFLEPGKVYPTIETLETLFIDAYLIAVTEFTKAGKADYARYAGEIGGVEAQHLALARFAEKKLPDDRSFQGYSIKSIAGIVAALEHAGIGLGKRGSKSPGKFYSFSPPPASALATITHNTPM
ncbi:MAG TPA: ferritin-like domain-containing protein [Solirubrobacteraceae bacterium]|nr:ferritin-like domain-containing protein [Solirubrobacteraceae bacterium]